MVVRLRIFVRDCVFGVYFGGYFFSFLFLEGRYRGEGFFLRF